MSRYRRPFVRQEPQAQRERLSKIARYLHNARCDMRVGSYETLKQNLNDALAALDDEIERLLPPMKVVE